MQLHLTTALNQLAEFALGSDDASEVLEAMARVVGAALQVDRSLVYEVLLDEGVTVCQAEWLRPEVQGLQPSRGTYPLAVFGNAATLLAQERTIVTSDRSAPHPAIGAAGWQVLHEQLDIGSLLWHPFNFRSAGFHLLAFNQVAERRWTDEEIAFIEAVGRQVNLALVKLDLTADRQRTLDALAVSEARYRALYDAAPSWFFTLDRSLRVVAVNRYAREQLGRTEAELVGAPVSDALRSASADEVREGLAACLAEPGRVFRWEGQTRRADGTVLVTRQTARAGSDALGDGLLVVVAEDVTDQKETEKALIQAQKWEMLGVLVGTIAHDFNNLLAMITGNTELALLRLGDGAPAREPVGRAATAANRAVELVKQLLSYSVKSPVARERVDLNGLVRETAALLEVTVGRRARMHLDLDPSGPAVEGDAVQLRQVLMNLVHNAGDAMEGGDGDIWVRTRREGAAGEEVALVVSDTGVGIPASARPHIFGPFFTTKRAGRGLGLSAVQAIAERHRGRIDVDSAEGQGATFRLVLPAAVDRADLRPPVGASAGEPNRRAGATILIVDDEQALLEVVASFVETFGDRPLVAGSVEEALGVFDAHPAIDAVLLDLTMPSGGGARLARLLRERRPGLPIALMSGFAQRDLTADLAGLLDAILPKPFSGRDLRRTLDQVLGRPSPAGETGAG
jgi:PAS domain S-box-containing protein